jgi:hypothetical protein
MPEIPPSAVLLSLISLPSRASFLLNSIIIVLPLPMLSFVPVSQDSISACSMHRSVQCPAYETAIIRGPLYSIRYSKAESFSRLGLTMNRKNRGKASASHKACSEKCHLLFSFP